jgi:hypothetical protein
VNAFSQQYMIDYDETFSPMAKITTVRVLISLATSQSWRLWQMGVKNAFFQTELELSSSCLSTTWFIYSPIYCHRSWMSLAYMYCLSATKLLIACFLLYQLCIFLLAE